MYERFHCGAKAVVWEAGFDFSDYGYDGEGIVHVYQCANCGIGGFEKLAEWGLIR